jgi:GDP-4-dehydro-6-deoxy-D-mannose reductase
MTTPPRILVTGAAGFVGSHLLDLLQADSAELIAWRRSPLPTPHPPLPIHWMTVDLLDRDAVHRAIDDVRPSAIYHCAGASHVGQSWDRTSDTLAINVLATHHLFEAIRRARLKTRVLVPSSSYVYRASEVPITEEHPIGPNTPYGFSKLAQETLGMRVARYDGIDAIVSRSFNHIGPRQDPTFFASGVARRLALIEAGRAEPFIDVGNLDTRRDLTDVRDTVRAYRALIHIGQPGRPYNVCSGRAFAMREVLDTLLAVADVRVDVRTDPSRYRPQDSSVIAGDPRRLAEETGWTPRIPLAQTLRDVFEYWRAQVASRQ